MPPCRTATLHSLNSQSLILVCITVAQYEVVISCFCFLLSQSSMFVCFCCCIVALVCMFRFSFLFVCCFVVMPSCEGMSYVTGCRGLARVVGPHRVIICSSQSEQTDHMIPWWPAVPAEQGQWRLSFRSLVPDAPLTADRSPPHRGPPARQHS